MASCQPLENTVIYNLFPGIHEDINSNLNVVDRLEIAAEKYINKISGFLNRYIWHNDPFNLHVTELATVPHLKGLTRFEDNVEDEWFIVYLLFYLTEKDKNLIVQIEDEDGDFLLIEAADYLPNWLNPDTSENRVFIYQGSLHIIPVARSPSDVSPLPSGTPSLQDALSVLRNFSSITKATENVQRAIQSRISGYPHKIDELKHRTHCYVPAAVAAILKEDLHLIAPAVKAFYLRDPIDLKACKAMKFFAPETCVMTEVVFTRCLYAQLTSQEYEPDKRTGWNLPSPSSAQMKACKLGMKLACGFEILVAGAEKLLVTDEELDFISDVRWKRFLKSLQDRGYFRGEIEGTPAYNRLLHQAQDFYVSSLRRNDNYNLHPGLHIQKLLQSVNFSYEEMKENEQQLKPPDDDSWMDITPEVLDSMLEKMSKQPSELAQKITGGLKTFLQQESGIDGVDMTVAPQKNKKQKINFDEDAFTESVNKILDFRIPEMEGDASSSSMSGYSDDDDADVSLSEERTKGSENMTLNDQMQSYMEEMDQELAKTNIGLSFEKLPPPAIKKAPIANSDIDSEDDDFQPVDVDLNALKNILESYSSQQGMPGPISTLYASMGMELPDDDAS